MNKAVIYAGDLRIYSVPSALVAHVEWAINQQLGQSHQFNWIPQPLSPGAFALEISWQGPTNVAGKLAIALKSWNLIRFEIHESNSKYLDGILFRCTPDLGLHQISASPTGELMINENSIKRVIATATSQKKLVSNLENAIGVEWDSELEPFRIALAELHQQKFSQIG
jgi:hypothetical protein